MPIHLLDTERPPVFPEFLSPDDNGLIALGGALTPEVIIEAYSKGIFPWTGRDPIPWFSPDPRMLLYPAAVRVRRSLRQTLRRGVLEVREDTCFRPLMRMCANIDRAGQDGTWITQNMVRTWSQLHRMGFAHSVETFKDGELVGGLYGLAIGGAFFGESMCSKVPDASKVALVHLCIKLEALDFSFVDCQQDTAHMAKMGAETVPRHEFLSLLADAVAQPQSWSPASKGLEQKT